MKLSGEVPTRKLPRALQDGIPLDLLPAGWRLQWRAPANLREAMAQGGLDEVRRVVNRSEANHGKDTSSKGRPPKPHDKNNTKISFTVSHDIAAEWQAMARARGLSLAEFVRRMLYARMSIVDDSVRSTRLHAEKATYKAERLVMEQLADAAAPVVTADPDDE